MARRLLSERLVDSVSVIRAASELFHARNHPSVVAVCSDGLEEEPDNAALRLLRARAWLAMRCDVEAQSDLTEMVRLDPTNPAAYRVFGELSAQREDLESARIFFHEALRLDPGDRESKEWLAITSAMVRPTAVAEKLPAAAAAVGHPILSRAAASRPRPEDSGRR